MRRRALSGCLLVVPLLLATAADAAARGPVYRDPPTYRGTTKAPAAKAPPQVRATLSGTGDRPDVLVDDAGTAHIVWNEGRGDDSDAAVYCRLERGATDCDTRATLTWEKSYGTGDGPQFNIDNLGPKIVRVGDQIVVLSKRYPTIGEKPDGASSSTVVAWVSNDGGTSWPNASNPATVGKYDLGQLAVFGPPDDPTILNVAQDPFCGMCVEAYKSGQYTGGGGNLAASNDQAYNGAVALGADGVPVAGFTDANANAFVRRWSGSGSVQDPATWGPPAGFRGEALTLAGGPAGVYAMAKPELVGGPFEVRRLGTGSDSTVQPGQPTTVSDEQDVIFGRIAQDPSGRAIAAWSRRGGPAPGVVQRLASAGSLSFGEAERLIDGQQNGQIAVAAAFDGGGFTVFNHTGGCCDAGEIVAAGFGNPAPTGRPGLGAVPGGGLENVTCQNVKFGSFTVDTAAGCFLQGSGSSGKGKVVSGNEIELNGLRIVPDAGVKVIVDPKLLRIDTTGDVRVIATAPVVGDFVLWHGQLHRDLSTARPGSNLFEFAAGEFDANLFGFDLAADIPVRLENGGVRIPVDLELPKAFGGFTGHAELVARKGQGLVVDSLDVHIGPVPLGVLVVNSIDLKYTGSTDTWEGAGSVTVPAGGTIDASARFVMGDFAGAKIDFTPASPIPIGPFVYLLSMGGGFDLQPNTHIEATARFGLGAAVNGGSPVGVNGKFEMTFPRNGPGHFKLSGTVSVLLFETGSGFLEFYTDGYAAFGGRIGPLELGPLNIDAQMGGFVDAGSGDFGVSLDGKIEVCAPVLGCGSSDVEFAINNRGFAVCAGLGPLRIGLRFPWEDFDPLMLVSPFYAAVALAEHFSPDCNTNGYRTPPPRGLRKAQSGGVTVDVPANLPSETILVKGEQGGGAPRVAVTGPNGQAFNSDQPSDAGTVVYARGLDAAYVLLKKPAGGAWTVTPMDGSPKFGEVKLGDGYLPATVNGRLGGTARRRTISYSTANLANGQAVRFAERGAFGTRLLGRATKPKGSLGFTPVDARGSKRTVLALIEKDGIVVDEVTIGRFTAPAPARPAAPGSLRARRKANRVTVTWKPGKGSSRQIVRLRGKNTNLARLVSGKTRKVVFTAVRRDEPVTIEVRGVSARQRLGAVRKVRVARAR